MIAVVVTAAAGSLALLLFTVFGCPRLLRLRAAGRRAPSDVALDEAARAEAASRSLPTVTVVVATRDAPDVIVERVLNLRASDYPAGRLQVVVGVDALATHPVDGYVTALAGLAEVTAGDQPGGKAAALNAAVRRARGDVLVFADSRQQFTPNAIHDLVLAVGGEGVGAVSGMVVAAKDDGLMDRYWEYELRLRRHQAAVHSIICVSGAIYALRRELWVPMPAALICDDLFVTLGLVMRGWRVGFCEQARAVDPRSFTRTQHFDRKVRTLTGLLQLCAWMPAVLLPWRNAIWIDFAIHKLMRVLVPYLAMVVALGALWVVWNTLGVATLWLALGAAALVAALLAVRPALIGTVGWALKLFTAPLLAAGNALRGRWQVWPSHPGRATATEPAP